MARRVTASDRMRRVLAVVPWIMANPGRSVDEVASRFELTKAQLIADLEVVWMVGLPPYSPDALIDVVIDDEGRVSIELADYFSRPLNLTPGQGLALLASSDALLSIPGTDQGGALARALSKLGAILGPGAESSLDMNLGDAEALMIDQLRHAVDQGVEVDVLYYSYGRDQKAFRRIVPWRVFSENGAWYVHAWCHQANQERLFRLDRIEDFTVTQIEASMESSSVSDNTGRYNPRPDDPTVTLGLAPEANWVADTYPCTVIEDNPDGSMIVEIAVSAKPWLERLLIRLGTQAQIVDSAGIDGVEVRHNAASRILARYKQDP